MEMRKKISSEGEDKVMEDLRSINNSEKNFHFQSKALTNAKLYLTPGDERENIS